MYVFLFQVFFISVFAASDDSSLMQQAIGVASSSTQWQSHMTQLREMVSEIQHPGKLRQLAISKLMDTLEKEKQAPGPPSAQAITYFNQIVQLLQAILNGFKSEIEAEVSELNLRNEILADCNAAGIAEDILYDNASTDAQYLHELCRTLSTDPQDPSELDLRINASNTCDPLEAHIQRFIHTSFTATDAQAVQDTIPDTQNYGILKMATIEELFEQGGGAALTDPDTGAAVSSVSTDASAWTNYLVAQQAYWAAQWAKWYDEGELGCKPATQAWAAKRELCDQKQQTYENDFCTFVDYRVQRCGTLSTCSYNGAVSFNNLLATIQGYDTQRIGIATIIQRVVCIIQAIVNDQVDENTGTTCNQTVTANATLIEAAMTRTKPPPISEDSCFAIPGARPSNVTGWDTQEYSQMQALFDAQGFTKHSFDTSSTTRPDCD